ncbi:MAG: hypothetical protein GY760_18840 [Deltaproteobacteria bacterium]|nr:hypothetical protein [Deltaproteobacteria bacterium]
MKVTDNIENNKILLSLNLNSDKFDESFSFFDDKDHLYDDNFSRKNLFKSKIGHHSLQNVDASFERFKYTNKKSINVIINNPLESEVDSFFRLNPFQKKMINLKNFLSRLYKMPYENLSYFRNTKSVFRDGRQIASDYINKGYGGICVDFVIVTGYYLDKLNIKWFPLKSDIDDRKDCHIAIKAFINDKWYFIDPGLYLSPILIENRTKRISSGRYGTTQATYQQNSICLCELNNNNKISFSLFCNLNNIISFKSLYTLIGIYRSLPIMRDLHITRKASNGNLIEFHHGRFRKYNKNGDLLESSRIPVESYSDFIYDIFNIEKDIVEKAKQKQLKMKLK